MLLLYMTYIVCLFADDVFCYEELLWHCSVTKFMFSHQLHDCLHFFPFLLFKIDKINDR